VFLLYLDASGTSHLEDVDQKHYVLLGVAVHEGNWFALERRVRALKARYECPGIPLELHAADICCSIVEQDRIPDFARMDWPTRRAQVRAYRATQGSRARRNSNGCLHLTRSERTRLFEEALDLVGSHAELRLFAEVVDKSYLFRETGKRHAVGPAFEQVVSRFDAMLRVFDAAGTRGVNNGLLVADNDQDSELMRNLTELFRAQGHSWGTLDYVIDTPFFVDSRTVSGIQLADICAYAVKRYVGRRGQAPHEEANFMRIFHRFDRSGTRLHGLRHYCAARSCDCAICVERGHAV
jgi:hypothetical protein